MAFLKKISIGKTEIEGVAVIKNIKFGSKSSPSTAELHVFPDLATYQQLKDEERGFRLDEKGDPILVPEGKNIGKIEGVTKTLDYEKNLLRVESINSRNLGPEKDMQFRKELLGLFYKYFGEGEEI